MKDTVAAAPRVEPSKGPEWLTSNEAASLLGLTPDTLRAYRAPSKRRGPPHHRLDNGRVFYLRADVEAYLLRHEQQLNALAGGRSDG